MLNGKMPKIEKGVPLPELEPHKATRAEFLRSMKPGQSFVVTRKMERNWQAQATQEFGKGKWRMHRLVGKRTRFWRTA